MEIIIAAGIIAAGYLAGTWLEIRTKQEGLAHLLSHQAHTRREGPEPVIPLEHTFSNTD